MTIPTFNSESDLLEYFNEHYAQVVIGGEMFILKEKPSKDGQQLTYEQWKIATFHSFHASDLYNGKRASYQWLKHPERRLYSEMQFEPSAIGHSSDVYNLWQGYDVIPQRDGSCDLFIRHLKENVCQHDDDQYLWLMSWFADIFQNPSDPKGTVVIFTGRQGVGKSFAMDVVGKLFGIHYKKYQSGAQAFGKFNNDLKSLNLVGIDEGRFVANHKMLDKLKAQVTSDVIQIEAKGVDRVTMKHYARYMITSNLSATVRDDPDARRFAVFTVGDACKGDQTFFGDMKKQLEQGGYEKLLHTLLNWGIPDNVNLRDIPITDGLLEQKAESLPILSRWVYDQLQNGHDWNMSVDVRDFYQSYSDFFDNLKCREMKLSPSSVGRSLRKIFPDLTRRQKSGGYMYDLPDLSAARNAFDDYASIRWQWEDVDDVECITFAEGVSSL